MTVGMTDACDLAETAFLNLLADKQVNWVTASEETGVEHYACGINRRCQFIAFCRADAQGLFGKQLLFRLGSRQHQFFMTVRFRANNNRLNLGILPNLG